MPNPALSDKKIKTDVTVTTLPPIDHVVIEPTTDATMEVIKCDICDVTLRSLAKLKDHVSFSPLHQKMVLAAQNDKDQAIQDKKNKKKAVKEEAKKLPKAPEPSRLLYEGMQLFWRHKVTLQINIYQNDTNKTLEVVVLDQFSPNGQATIVVDLKKVEESVKVHDAAVLRRASMEKVVDHSEVKEPIVRFILSRLNIKRNELKLDDDLLKVVEPLQGDKRANRKLSELNTSVKKPSVLKQVKDMSGDVNESTSEKEDDAIPKINGTTDKKDEAVLKPVESATGPLTLYFQHMAGDPYLSITASFQGVASIVVTKTRRYSCEDMEKVVQEFSKEAEAASNSRKTAKRASICMTDALNDLLVDVKKDKPLSAWQRAKEKVSMIKTVAKVKVKLDALDKPNGKQRSGTVPNLKLTT